MLPLATRAALRIVLVLLGLSGALWSAWVMYRERDAASLSRYAERMLAGHTYTLQQLSGVLAHADSKAPSLDCRGGAAGEDAVLRLYAAAVAVRTQSAEAASRLETARRSIRSFLSCSPHHAFSWYALFWVEVARGEPLASTLKYLEMSYELGPREAWISRYRVADALPFFEIVPPRLQGLIRDEFLHLMRDDLKEAVAVVKHASEPVRGRLLAFTEAAPIDQRRELAAMLDRENVVVNVPGVEYRDGRAVPTRRRAGS